MKTFVTAALLAAIAVPLSAATRLTYAMKDGSAAPVYWPASSFPIPYQVDRRVTTNLPPGTLDKALAVWTSTPDADIRFEEKGVADGLKAGKDGNNIITVTDDLFKNQKAIAITTNWYDGTGKLIEADVQVDAALGATEYNVPQALAHEIGHVLGLDHSPVLSAIMFPYVPRGNETPSLDSDDRTGIAAIYPRRDTTLMGGTLQGKVIGDGGGVFAAQVVAVNDKGEPVATVLTNSFGEFELRAVPPGTYRIYAEPLDGPVDARNMTGVWRAAKVTSFPTRFCEEQSITLDTGKVVGNLQVNSSGVVQLNPKWIGVDLTGGDGFNLTTNALSVKPAQTFTLAVAGDGFTSGMTTFQVMNPAFKRVSDFTYAGNYVYARFEIEPTAAPGSAVVLVSSGTQTAALTGALRVQGPSARTRGVRR